jgi:LPS sulfotransferase NodH
VQPPPRAPEAGAARPTPLRGSRGRLAEPNAVCLDPSPGHPRQAVSLWKALQTQQWRRNSDEDAAAKGLRFSFAAVNHLKLRIDEHNAAWQGFFDGCGVEPLEVVYEDLVEDCEGTVLRLLDDIDTSIAHNFTAKKPRMKRQADNLSRKWARLYDDRAAARTSGKG